MLAACGPSKEELARQKEQARAQANRAAIAACQDRNTQAANAAAQQISDQQTIIRTTLDKVTENSTQPDDSGDQPSPDALDWSIEIASLDPSLWRWTETSRITSRHSGFLGSTSTRETQGTITYTLNPADLQGQLSVVPHDDGTAAVRFYCKSNGCIHLVGATRQDQSSNLPFSGTDSKAGTVSQSANSGDWLLSTRTRAEGLKAAIEKLLELQAYHAPACTNADGTPSEAAPLLPFSAQ